MKILKAIVVLVVVAVIGVVLARYLVVRNIVQTVLAEQLGAEVEVGEMDVDIWRSTVSLTDIRFANPEGFHGDTALEINRLDLTYRFFSLFTRTVRLPRVVLDVNRVVMVTNEEGQTNLEQFVVEGRERDWARTEKAVVTTEETTQPVEAVPEPRRTRARRETHIDRLDFRLGEVEMRDYSRSGPEPAVRNYRLNLERTFTDVRELESIAQAVGTDLAMTMGPQLFRDLLDDSGVRTEDLLETISEHNGDLEELGRKLDEQTKDLQRELRQQFRSLRERAE